MAASYAFALGLFPIFSSAQPNSHADNCDEELSLYYEFMQSGDMQGALKPWEYAFNNCPDRSKNIYIHGIRILVNLIQKTKNPADKQRYKEMLMQVFDRRLKYFPENKAFVLAQKASYMKDFKMGLPRERQDIFQRAFADDYEQKVGAKSILNYFYNATEIFNSDKDFQKYLNSYEAISKIIDYNINTYSEEAGALIELKDSAGLNANQERNLKVVKVQRKNLNTVKTTIEQLIGQVATCDQLIPLVTRNFNAHKSDEKWLHANAVLLAKKGCEGTSVFSKIVEAFYALNPAAPAARGLASRAYKAGKYQQAIKYFKEAAKLEHNRFQKAADEVKIASILFKQGHYATARRYANRAADMRPGWGKPYLLIAAMYAKSANTCGTDEFSKRAVYWAAADMARKAAHIDPSVAAKAQKALRIYLTDAPDKSMAFHKGYKPTDRYKIDCWINTTTTVRWQ